MSNSDSDYDSNTDQDNQQMTPNSNQTANTAAAGPTTKQINLTSFSYGKKKPATYTEDIIISTKDLFNTCKAIKDTNDGTAIAYQTALMEGQSNREKYTDIVEEILNKVLESMKSEDDEEIGIYISCDNGKHRSVAVACMLYRDLRPKLEAMIDPTKSCLKLSINHRDLFEPQHRKDKKNLSQARARNRDRKMRMGGMNDFS
jgi:RNase adaptor protein for sRNA GlmZ degradation